MKYVLWLFVAIFLWRWLLTGLRRSARGSAQEHVSIDQSMVPCAACGVFVPEKETLAWDGRFYCSVAHRDSEVPHD